MVPSEMTTGLPALRDLELVTGNWKPISGHSPPTTPNGSVSVRSQYSFRLVRSCMYRNVPAAGLVRVE